MFYGTSLSLLVAIVFAIIAPLLDGAILEKRLYRVLENPKYPNNPGFFGPPQILGGTQAVAPVAPAAAATLDAPATPASLAIDITSFPPPAITAPPPPPSGLANCTPLPQCRLYYSFVNVYYWPQESQNSSCVGADQLQQIESAPPDIANIQSPSVYVVFPSIMAFDGCRYIGQTLTGLTTSFAPTALSTYRSGNWTRYPFNFADLPCPPADVPWNRSEGRYQPILAPPDFLFTIDPAFSTCTPAASQGIDPFKPLSKASNESPARNHFCSPQDKHC